MNREDVFAVQPGAPRRGRQPSWEKYTPILWAPVRAKFFVLSGWSKGSLSTRTMGSATLKESAESEVLSMWDRGA